MGSYIKLMRVHHYIKNLLIFAALACSGQLFELDKLKKGIVGFAAFCMISSVVYIINDIKDKDKDKLHPTKCSRPIASGKVSLKQAICLALILFAVSVLCSCLVFNIAAIALLALYLCLNLAYSCGLKNIPLLDVTILVSGFLIRILYGAFLTDITISNWLYLTVIALAFYFALSKRRNELRQSADGNTRKVLKAYPIEFLDKNMYMCMTLANVFYALWSMDQNTVMLYNNKYIIFTVPLVLLITMKYSFDIEGTSDGDPVEVLVHDKVLVGLCTVYLAVMFVILYF